MKRKFLLEIEICNIMNAFTDFIFKRFKARLQNKSINLFKNVLQRPNFSMVVDTFNSMLMNMQKTTIMTDIIRSGGNLFEKL